MQTDHDIKLHRSAVETGDPRPDPRRGSAIFFYFSPQIFFLALPLILIGCNRDQSQTIDTSMLSAPTSPQPEPGSPADQNTPAASPAQSQPEIAQQSAAPAANSPITYQLPAGWSQQPGTDMRFATLTGPERVQIAITVFPGDVGGTLANINRWRRQMDLPPIPAEQLDKTITTIPLAGGSALLADLSNHDQRMLGAIVPGENQTWFLKMSGPSPTIARHKAEFLAILKSIQKSPQH